MEKCKPKDMMKFNPLRKSILSFLLLWLRFFFFLSCFSLILSLYLLLLRFAFSAFNFGLSSADSLLHKIAKWAIRPDCTHWILLFGFCTKKNMREKSKEKKRKRKINRHTLAPPIQKVKSNRVSNVSFATFVWVLLFFFVLLSVLCAPFVLVLTFFSDQMARGEVASYGKSSSKLFMGKLNIEANFRCARAYMQTLVTVTPNFQCILVSIKCVLSGILLGSLSLSRAVVFDNCPFIYLAPIYIRLQFN